jgi:hypothetical protein
MGTHCHHDPLCIRSIFVLEQRYVRMPHGLAVYHFLVTAIGQPPPRVTLRLSVMGDHGFMVLHQGEHEERGGCNRATPRTKMAA